MVSVFCMLVIPVGEFEYLITVITSLAYFETLPYILSVVSRPVVVSPNVVFPYCIMAALCNMGAIIFLPYSFFLSSVFFFFFFSSSNLSGHRLDVYHTSTHGVALVRI